MKIALVHDQLIEFGGAERVLIAFKKIFPKADVYTLVYQPEKLGPIKKVIRQWSVKVSWFGKLPIIKNFYSPFRFLTPLIWESFDFSNYDLVISSSGSWMAKGIKTKKPTIHLAYIHHPPRYLYGYETAVEWQRYWPVKIYAYVVNHFLRMWDFKSSQRPGLLVANSQETEKRIKKFYRRQAVVVYPPVDISNKMFQVKKDKLKYYITISRLARAKHVDILIKAANKMGFYLKIIGTGRDERYLRSIAGPTVEFLGHINDHDFKKIFSQAKAFLFASKDEEFGIAPVEAMGYGLPVIAYASGGITEYLKEGVNGFLYHQLDENFLLEKIKKLENLEEKKYQAMRLLARKTAEQFSFNNFKKNILKLVKKITY